MSRRARVDLEAFYRLTEIADYIVPFALRVICDLRLADHLTEGPRPVAELAERTETHAPSLLRALRALASRGIFQELDEGVFALTPRAEPLRSDHPYSLVTCWPLMPSDVRSWARLDHSVRTGQPAFDHVHGMRFYDWCARHPYESERFDQSVQSVNPLVLRSVAAAHPWASHDVVVDVGGGNGSFLAGLLRRNQDLRGVLVDLSHVVVHAPAVLGDVADRCEVVAASFFDEVPAAPGERTVFLLKTVLHDWEDELAAPLLERVAAAMDPSSRLVVVESVRREGNDYDVGKIMDVKALALFGGHARTEDELRSLLGAAGLVVTTVTHTPTMSVIVAQRG